MKRSVEWTEKVEGGVKRVVRVSFPGKGIVKWQFQRSDGEGWDYDSPPTAEDWRYLAERLEGMVNRRRAAWETLVLVRKLKAEAGA